MTVSLPGRTTSYITTDGTNLPIQGSTIMEFPNPLPGQLKGQRATMSFGLNHETQLTSKYTYTDYSTTDYSAGYYTDLFVTWNTDGTISLSVDYVDDPNSPTPRNNAV